MFYSVGRNIGVFHAQLTKYFGMGSLNICHYSIITLCSTVFLSVPTTFEKKLSCNSMCFSAFGSLALLTVALMCLCLYRVKLASTPRSHLGILPFRPRLKRSYTLTVALANIDQYSLVVLHHGNLHLLGHPTLRFLLSSRSEVAKTVLQSGQGTSLMFSPFCAVLGSVVIKLRKKSS